MGIQKFYARPGDTHEFDNGAIGHRSEHLGPFAKVENCPIEGTDRRVTCYASDYPDTFFSVPARCRGRNGKTVRGFFTMDGAGVVFVPYNNERSKI